MVITPPQRIEHASSPTGRAGLRRLEWPSIAVVGLAGAAVLALVARTEAGARIALLTWLLMAPLCEEAFFRGLLHEALLRRLAPTDRLGRGGANVGVALAFGALHALSRDAFTGAAVVLPALLIGRAYGRTRRLLPAVALHASFNLAWLAWGRPGAEVLATLAARGPAALDILSILQE